MNSGKSMDDILDSIRKIVHEEETGEVMAPAAKPVRPGRGADREGEMDTLVLTREMRVDQDDTLHLSNREATEEERDAVAALRLGALSDDEGDDADGALNGAAIGSLRRDRDADHSAEVAAFDAALTEDEFDDEAEESDVLADDGAMDLSALDETESEAADGADRDLYGFAEPPRETPYRGRAGAEAGKSLSLRLDRDAPEAEEAVEDAASEDDGDGDGDGDGGMAFSLGGVAAALRADDEDAAEAPEEARAPSAPAGDEDEIKRLVREAVREELSGALGDRITRNIRGMVRREIKRAMETKQIT